VSLRARLLEWSLREAECRRARACARRSVVARELGEAECLRATFGNTADTAWQYCHRLALRHPASPRSIRISSRGQRTTNEHQRDEVAFAYAFAPAGAFRRGAQSTTAARPTARLLRDSARMSDPSEALARVSRLRLGSVRVARARRVAIRRCEHIHGWERSGRCPEREPVAILPSSIGSIAQVARRASARARPARRNPPADDCATNRP